MRLFIFLNERLKSRGGLCCSDELRCSDELMNDE